MSKIVEEWCNEAARKAAREAEKKAIRKTAKETAERMIKKGKFSLEDIAECVPSLSLDELKKLESKIMQLA